MEKILIYLFILFIPASIYGFGTISRGVYKHLIIGLGAILTFITLICSFLFFEWQIALALIFSTFIFIMPLVGFVMAVVERILFKEYTHTRELMAKKLNMSESELRHFENFSTGDDIEDAKNHLRRIGIDLDAEFTLPTPMNDEKKVYKVGGIRKGIREGEPYYGTGAKVLVKENNEWKIIISPTSEEFHQEPKEVDEETFIKIMTSLGMPLDQIHRFIKYEIDWENF